MDLHVGDLVFTRGGFSRLDKPMMWLTRNPYTHVAGAVGPRKLLEARMFHTTGYVELTAFRNMVDVFHCPHLSARQRRIVAEYVEDEIGTRYDYLMLLWQVFRLLTGYVPPYLKNPRRICSTLWADAYREAGMDLCPGVPYPTPGELAASPLLTKIGEY
ncbi:hypothetical protein [Alicyclobacillus herbarius]|uniref:hypothetical protein n=1 Tax=Alicyclobacillus herbarius TaxID=122960 RepID=UPI000408E04D|nr:hypothetical protein [Alicyclobacillus herbarius]